MSPTCNACGEEWEVHPALVVECPSCFALPGRDCVRPSGHSGPFVEPHVSREQLAVDRGLLALCPKGPTATTERSGQPKLSTGQNPLPTLIQPTLLALTPANDQRKT